MSRRGVTLLETMIALVILSLVVTAALELYGSSLNTAVRAESWSIAVDYAEEAMELAKLDPLGMAAQGPQALPGGFERAVELRPAGAGLSAMTVTVRFPEGGDFRVRRLVRTP